MFEFIFQAIICLVILIMNSFSIVAIWRAKLLRIHIKCPLMVVAICDFLTGFTLVFFRLTVFLGFSLGEGFCRLIFLVLVFTTYTVQLVLATLSCDRCICLYLEMQYVRFMTQNKTIITYISVCIVSLVISLIKNAADFQEFTECKYDKVVGSRSKEFFIVFGNCIRIITFTSFIFLFRKLKQIISKTRPLGIKSFSKTFFGSATKCVFIALTFQIMYLPFGINELIGIWRPDLAKPGTPLFYFGSLFVLLNSVINPFLYGFRFRECRIEITKLFCFWNKKLISELSLERKLEQAPYLNHQRY